MYRKTLNFTLLILVIVFCLNGDCGMDEGTHTKSLTRSATSEQEARSKANQYFKHMEEVALPEYDLSYSIIYVEEISHNRYKITYTVTQTKL